MSRINVPLDLIKGYSFSKERRMMLGLGMAIKAAYLNSTLYNATSTIQHFIHVSHGKARNLLAMAKDSELFYYNEKYDFLRVKSFKSKQERKNNKGETFTCDYCVKFRCGKNYTMKSILEWMDETLILAYINGYETNKLIRENQYSVGTMALRAIGTYANMSKSKVSRVIKRCVEKNKIDKERARMIMVLPEANEAAIAEWKRISNRQFLWVHPLSHEGYIKRSCIYTIIRSDVRNSFKHIIWNHSKRIRACNVVVVDDEAKRICNTNSIPPQLLGF